MMMDEKELNGRAAALEIANRIHPTPQSILLYVSSDNTRRSDQEVPLSLGHQGGSGLSAGQMKIRNVMFDLEKEIRDALKKAERKLRAIALESWEGK